MQLRLRHFPRMVVWCGVPECASAVFLVPCSVHINPFPPLLLSDSNRICETILMTPRAAADRPRALGYMVWMRTIDT